MSRFDFDDGYSPSFCKVYPSKTESKPAPAPAPEKTKLAETVPQSTQKPDDDDANYRRYCEHGGFSPGEIHIKWRVYPQKKALSEKQGETHAELQTKL